MGDLENNMDDEITRKEDEAAEDTGEGAIADEILMIQGMIA